MMTDETARYRREEIRKHASNVTEAVKIAGSHVGLELADYQARYIAEVARSFAESTLSIREALHRDQWAIEGLREHVRQTMRRELFETVTRQGLIPVDLAAETLRYIPQWGYSPGTNLERATQFPEVPAEAVERGAEWETVILTLSVPIRRPPVDRAKAVSAGILTGGQ